MFHGCYNWEKQLIGYMYASSGINLRARGSFQ